MSKVFQKIQEAETNALQEIDTVKNTLKESQSAAKQKAKSIIDSAMKDADISYSNKVNILEAQLMKSKEEAIASLVQEVSKVSGNSKDLIATGVEFLFPRLLSRA